MYCSKCGYLLNNEPKFCPNCGEKINNSNNYEKQEKLETIDETNDKNDFDERLIKAYIGSNADVMYEKAKMGGISILSLIFGVGYFMYRKMYLVSLITIISGTLISILLPNVTVFVNTFVGLMFFPLYKWDITRKLRKIKYGNSLSQDDMLLLAKNKGGTSILGAILFAIIYIGLLVLYFLGGRNGLQ